MQDVTSIESEMEMGFTFETEGFSEEESDNVRASKCYGK